MTWITAALVVAALMAVVSVVDSHLISRRMPSFWTFLIPAGVIHLSCGLIFFALHPPVSGVDAFPWFMAVVSAVTRTAAALLMLYAMRTEEVTRIIPVVYAHPVVVAILAVPLLGESLNYLQWMAIFMTVAGAVLISLKSWGQGRGVRLRRSFVMLLASSLLFGVANVATKYASDYISFWNMYSITAICFGGVFCLLSMRPKVLRDLWGMTGRGFTLTVIAFNEMIALAGIVLSFWAIERGPVSLVSTILGIRPAIVFLCAVALTRILPSIVKERLTRGVVITKTASIALIIIGVTIINT